MVTPGTSRSHLEPAGHTLFAPFAHCLMNAGEGGGGGERRLIDLLEPPLSLYRDISLPISARCSLHHDCLRAGATWPMANRRWPMSPQIGFME